MKKLLLVIVVTAFSSIVLAQGKFYTKTGKISFFSSTSLENIEATNKSAVGLIDSQSGEVTFSVLMKGFEFRKALMQEHFNDKYVESNKFPKAEFKGVIVNNNAVRYTVNGSYPVTVKGKLTLHGVTKDREIPGTITVKDGKITVVSTFNVIVADHSITIPKLYRDNISKSIKVSVNCVLEAL